MTRMIGTKNLRTRIAVGTVAVGLLVGCGGGAALGGNPEPPRSWAALGASDVVGVGAQSPESEGWAPVLARMLPAGTRFAKVGVSGWQAHQARDLGLPEVLKAEPDAVVVWLGVNDFLAGKPRQRFAVELDGILEPLAASGAQVYVLNLPSLDRLPAFRGEADRIRQSLPAWQATVRSEGAEAGAEVIDLARYTAEVEAHPEFLSGDGFHPSAGGYRRLAEIVYEAIR